MKHMAKCRVPTATFNSVVYDISSNTCNRLIYFNEKKAFDNMKLI